MVSWVWAYPYLYLLSGVFTFSLSPEHKFLQEVIELIILGPYCIAAHPEDLAVFTGAKLLAPL